MKFIYKSKVFESIYSSAESLYRCDVITRERMQEYADGCLKNKIVIDDDYFTDVIHENEELETKRKVEEWLGGKKFLDLNEYKKSKTNKK